MNRNGKRWLHRCTGVLIAASVFGCFGQRAVYAEEEGITKKKGQSFFLCGSTRFHPVKATSNEAPAAALTGCPLSAVLQPGDASISMQ